MHVYVHVLCVCVFTDHIEAHDERAAAEVDRGNKQLGTVVRYKVRMIRSSLSSHKHQTRFTRSHDHQFHAFSVATGPCNGPGISRWLTVPATVWNKTICIECYIHCVVGLVPRLAVT